MIADIENFIKRHTLLSPDDSVVLGLSGGPDSVFLLHFLVEYARTGNIKQIIAAHLNHEWRPNSASDVAFCAQLTEKYGVPFIHAKASELKAPLKQTGSKEDIGRQLRRYFFEMVCKEYNADKIALAHHAQDQEETFFIRLIRGTTLSGLVGMKPQDGKYIRPLLEVNKKDIVAYLDKQEIPYLIDPTNEQESFLRNRIRKYVLPAFAQCDQRFNANFLRTMHSLQKTEYFLNMLTQKTFDQITESKNEKLFLNVNKLQALDHALVDRVLMHWLINAKVPFVSTEQFLDEIKRFVFKAEGGSHQLHETWVIHKKNSYAWIEYNRTHA